MILHFNIKQEKCQYIIFFLFSVLAILIFIPVLFTNIDYLLKIAIISFLAFLPIFAIKPTFFIYYIFLLSPALRIISPEKKIFGDINFNALLQLSIIFFSLFIIIKNKKYLIKKIKKTIFLKILLIFLFVALTSIIYTNDHLKTIYELTRTFSIFFLFFAIIALFKNKKDIYYLLLSMLFGAFIPSVVAIYQFFTKTGWMDYSIDKLRIYGTLTHPATFSFYLLVLIPIIYTLFTNTKNNQKKIFFLSIIFIFSILILLSLTRGAWIAFVAMAFIYGITKNRKALLAMMIIFSLTYVFHPAVKQRVNDIFVREENSSFQARINIFNRTVKAVKEKPILGYGFGGFENVNLKYNEEAYFFESRAAHNDYLRILIELGFVGLFLYLLLYFSLFFQIFKYYQITDNSKNKNFYYSLLVLIIGVIILNAGDNLLRTIPVQFLFWGYIGANIAYFDIKKEATNKLATSNF